MCGYYGFPPLIIIYSRDHGYNSYVKFQLGLENSITTSPVTIEKIVPYEFLTSS